MLPPDSSPSSGSAVLVCLTTSTADRRGPVPHRGQLELGELARGERSDALEKTCLGDSPQLKRQSDGRFWRAIVERLDEGGTGDHGSLEVGSQWNDKNGLQGPRKSIALPDDNRTSAGLLLGPVRPEISPPDLAALHRWSCRSSWSAQAARPDSAKARSSSGDAPKRAGSQRRASAGRIRMSSTCSPSRRWSGRSGLRAPRS